MNGVRMTEVGPKRLSTSDMAALQTEHGTEFAQIYVTGPGRNGGGGKYYLIQGNAGSASIPLRGDVRLINHTHPEFYNGYRVPLEASIDDKVVLSKLQRRGSPQRQSQVVPEVGAPFTFRKF